MRQLGHASGWCIQCSMFEQHALNLNAQVSQMTVTFTGTIPSSWAHAGAFRNLHKLLVSNLSISGSLPATWGSKSFPNLVELNLQNLPHLKGSLPIEWGGANSFQQLQLLVLQNCSITGGWLYSVIMVLC
jgi:hypothetical protein